MRDLLDLRQAFAAGVHFLIHKPASAVQIERCLRAAYCATVARRRKAHREPVRIVATVSTRTQQAVELMMLNLSEGGMGLQNGSQDSLAGVALSAGDEVDIRFTLPGTDETIHTTGRVAWASAKTCGVKFSYIPEAEQTALQQWITGCVERSLAELCERVRAACA